jgi:hypothetical protein
MRRFQVSGDIARSIGNPSCWDTDSECFRHRFIQHVRLWPVYVGFCAQLGSDSEKGSKTCDLCTDQVLLGIF